MTDVETAQAPRATERPHGLRAGAVGFFGALAGSIGLQGPSGGASFLPALMAATVALSGPLAFGLGTIVMVFVAVDEVYYIIAGRLELSWDEGTFALTPRDCVYLAPGWTYSLKNVGDDPAFFVCAMTPSPQ